MVLAHHGLTEGGLDLKRFALRFASIAAMAAALTLASSALAPETAEAQDCAGMPCEQVEPGFKGVIGLGLVGAELGFIIPAVAGLHETWAFIVFPVALGAGGAVAGYFALEQTNETELSVASLAFGMAMIIPTMVITLAATAYDPDDEGEVSDGGPDFDGEFEETEGGVRMEGGGSVGGEEEAPAEPGPEAERMRQRRIVRTGTGLFRWSEDTGLLLGTPGLAFAPSYTGDELMRFGGEQETELHLSLVSGAF